MKLMENFSIYRKTQEKSEIYGTIPITVNYASDYYSIIFGQSLVRNRCECPGYPVHKKGVFK
jgi:hypothetical protein